MRSENLLLRVSKVPAGISDDQYETARDELNGMDVLDSHIRYFRYDEGFLMLAV